MLDVLKGAGPHMAMLFPASISVPECTVIDSRKGAKAAKKTRGYFMQIKNT
jgi:hypothetical protein